MSTAPSHPRLFRPVKRRKLTRLTPLIDIVFILLVFFMLASSFMTWRSVELNAPGEAVADSMAENVSLLVEIEKDGIRLAGERMSPEDLKRAVEQHMRADPEQRFLLQPSEDVPLQQLVSVLDQLKLAGANNLDIVSGGSS